MSKRNEWSTPKELFDLFDDLYHFDLDVCASEHNTKCAKYITKEQDALTMPWEGSCWMNPPYDNILKWLEKAYKEVYTPRYSIKEPHTRVLALLPASTDTRWWHDFVTLVGAVWFVKGRIHFENGSKTGRAPFGSALFLFDPLWDRNTPAYVMKNNAGAYEFNWVPREDYAAKRSALEQRVGYTYERS